MEVPPSGTKGGGRMLSALGFLLKPMSSSMVTRYRKSAGDGPGRFLDFPTVVLTTVGAKTGVERAHVLGGFEEKDGSWLVVASNGGSRKHPGWIYNLARQPDRVWLEVGRRKLKVTPQLLRGAEREAALARIAAGAPRYGEYQHKTDREIPIVRLTPE